MVIHANRSWLYQNAAIDHQPQEDFVDDSSGHETDSDEEFVNITLGRE